MPPSHTPIKKYNYERSLFRWVVSRHPEPFEKHGITTKTLERAPLAREAFYTSDWPGARSLVHCNSEYKYERTPFFDRIIERGLRDGTRFNVDHVTSDEKCSLGITMDRASGKYYLHAYGSARARRNPTRRGSATSSEDDSEHQHVVIRDLGDLLASEIEAAGENAEVHLSKSRFKPGPAPGSTVLNFSVLIQRRGVAEAAAAAGGGGSGGGGSGRTAGGAQEAGTAAAAADAGGGNPTGIATPRQRQQQQQQQQGRNGPAPKKRSQQQQQQGRNGPPPKKRSQQQQQKQQQQQQRQQGSEKRDSAVSVAAAAAALAFVSQGGANQIKAGGRPRSMSSSSAPTGAGNAGSGAAKDAAGGAGEPPKRRKSIAQAVFSTNNSLGTKTVKREPAPRQQSVFPPSSIGVIPGIDASYRAPSSTGSSNNSTSSNRAATSQPQPVTDFGGVHGAFGGVHLNANRSFLPGMGAMPQPFQHSFPAASSAPPSPSSPSQQRYGGAGAGAGAAPGGAVQRSQASAPNWNFAAAGLSGNYSARSMGGVATVNSGASADHGGDADTGVVAVSPSPQPVTSSWGLYTSSSGIRDGGEFGSQQDPPRASGSIKGEPEAGGGGPLPSLSQRFGERATLLDDHDHASSQTQEGALVTTLEPCTPYTQQQQSLSQQVSRVGGRGNGSNHGRWGGVVARTSGGLSSFSSTGGACSATASQDDQELDFLEVFF